MTSLQEARAALDKEYERKPDASKPRDTETVLKVFSRVNAAREIISAAFDVAQTRCGELRDAGKRQSAEYRQANAERAKLSNELTRVKRFKKALDAERKASFGTV